jgi:valyl-tRNA synthetase
LSKLNQTIELVEDHYSKFRISDALMAIYKLFWDDYCSTYLEVIKPAWGDSMDKATYDCTIFFFDSLLRLIHPVMPFITEELWHALEERKEGETIMFAPTPKAGKVDTGIIADFEKAIAAVASVRAVRQQKNISMKEALDLQVKGAFPESMIPVLSKLANVGKAEFVSEFSSAAGVSFMVGTVEMFIPLGGLVNVEEEIAKIEADLARQRGFLEGVRKKLSNENFVAHAPEKVVAMERKKEADSLSKIESLENQLKALKNS